MQATISRALQVEMIGEWITCAALMLFAMPFQNFIEPRQRMFRLDNPAIQFPMTAHEHVPDWLCIILVIIIPFFVIAFLSIGSSRLRKSTEVTLLAFVFAISLNMAVTNGLKFMIGNPRPDFLSRCMPKAGTPIDKLVNGSVCTSINRSVMHEAFKSSPSGHSSNSFCGLGFLALWLNGQVRLFGSISNCYQAMGFMSPFFLALYIAISRIIDYRHHWYDVLCGSIIGLSIAVGSYYLHFMRRPVGNPSRESIPV